TGGSLIMQSDLKALRLYAFTGSKLFFASFFFQAEDGIRDRNVTGVQTCALPISCPGAPGAVPRHGWTWGGSGEVGAAVDVDDAAGHEGALVRAQPQHRPGDVPGVAGPAQRDAGDGEIGRASCRERVEDEVGAVAE